MTREEAEAVCARNAREHPERATAQWRPRELPDGSWTVVKVGIAPLPDLTEETVADEKPPTPDDPRTAAMRNLGPHTGLPI
jgi:hypothetical protein